VVKLRTFWDNSQGGVLIGPDEPAGVKRKSNSDMIKYRAEHEGKSAVVTDATLII